MGNFYPNITHSITPFEIFHLLYYAFKESLDSLDRNQFNNLRDILWHGGNLMKPLEIIIAISLADLAPWKRAKVPVPVT